MKVILTAIATSVITTLIVLFIFNRQNKPVANIAISKVVQLQPFETVNSAKSEYTPYDFFGDECVLDVKKYCSKETSLVPVAHCLEKNNNLLSKQCRKQDKNPMVTFVVSCGRDIELNCKDIKLGGGRLINCLKSQVKLSKNCQSQVSPAVKK